MILSGGIAQNKGYPNPEGHSAPLGEPDALATKTAI